VYRLESFDIKYQIIHYEKLITVIYSAAKLIKSYPWDIYEHLEFPWVLSEADLMSHFKNEKDAEKDASVNIAKVSLTTSFA